MPISTVAVTGSYVPPDGSTIVGGQIVFALSEADTEGATVVSGETIAELDGDDLPVGFVLWRNTAGERGTYYKVRARVYISHVTAGGTFQTERSYQLGNIQVGDAASYTLTELLNNPVPDEPGWNVNIDPTEWAALQDDFDAADTAATNASASATAAGNSATAAAGSADDAAASAIAAAASADDASAAGAYAAAASASADDAAGSADDAAAEAAAASASAVAAAASEAAASDSASDAATDAGLALTRANAAGASATAAASSAGAASGSATAASGSATAASGSAAAAAASATAAAGSATAASAAEGFATAASASADDAAAEAAAAQGYASDAAASALAAAASEGAANVDAAQAVSAANDAAASAADAEAAKDAAEAARDEIRELYVTLEDFGAVGDGIADDSAAILAAAASGAKIICSAVGSAGKVYYFNSPITLSGLGDVVFDLTGCEVLQGPDANPGWQFVGCSDVYVIGGRSGKWTGNYDTAGPWKSHATTGGITDGDGTGAAAATYTGVNTITVNLLGTGYVKKGSRLSYIVSDVTYSYIVQSDVAIVAGVATNIVLDRVLDVSLASGRTVYISWYNRRMVLASAATAGATTLTLECGNVTSVDGAPMILAGDQFCIHTDNNDIDNIDYSHVFEVAEDAGFTGAYPAKTVTVTLTEPIPNDIPRGTMITSIMDHRNNRFVPILFWDCTRCGVIGMRLSKSRLHGFTANAVINSPWRGQRPSLYGSSDMVFCDNSDDSTTGAGGAIVGAWSTRMTVKGNNITYQSGSSRRAVNFERSSQTEIAENIITGGKDGIKLNGECTDIIISDNRLTDVKSAISQLNSCQRVTIESNHIVCDPLTTLVAIRVVAGLEGEEEAGRASTTRTNFTKIIDNTIEGGTDTTNPNYGDHIIVSPIGFNTATREEDYPRHVEVRGNISIGAGRNGIRAMLIDQCTIEENVIYRSGAEGIYTEATGGADNRINGNSVTDAGEVTASYAIRIVGGTDWEIADNIHVVDIGTGQIGDLLVEGGATVTKMRPSGPEATITPAHGGAAENGVTDDLAAYNAAFAAAPSEFRFLIEKPSVLSGSLTTGGKEPLFETTSRIAWASTTDVSRAMPGIADASLAATYPRVFHSRDAGADATGSMFVSFRALASSGGSYEKDGLIVIARTEDASTGTGNGGSGADVNRDLVGLGGRAYTATGNMAGRIWGMNAYARITSGSQGRACGIEVDVDNEALDYVTAMDAPFLKQGIHIVPKSGMIGIGVQINKGPLNNGVAHGFVVRSGAVNSTYGISAFEYEGKWIVDKDGDMVFGKPTKAKTEDGAILFNSGGAAQFTKSAGIGSTEFVRAGTIASSANIWNVDFTGYSSAGAERLAGRMQVSMTDATDGAEIAEFRFAPMVAGATANQARIGNGVAIGASAVSPGAGNLNLTGEYRVANAKVIGARITGWGAPTGTPTRTTFATGSVTLPQLAERVKALIDDLTTHGVIGA